MAVRASTPHPGAGLCAELEAALHRSGLDPTAASGAGCIPLPLIPLQEPAWGQERRRANGELLETAEDTAFHHFGAQTVSTAPTRELFVWFKALFILLWVSFPNHPLQVLGEGSVPFFLFPAHLPIPKTNILEQACGGEGALIKAKRR